MSTTLASCWQLHDTQAMLAWPGIDTARVDLLHPESGVQFSHEGHEWRVLGVWLDRTVERGTLTDAYVRVNDLVASYAPAPERPHHVQLYWQRLDDLPTGVLAAIDLQVLTNTELLDSNPRRITQSDIPSGEMVQVTTVDGRETVPCLVLRPAEARYSYIEMIHPLDFLAAGVQPDETRVRLLQELFTGQLEKGVILRSRLRAALVERERDVELARELYQRLLDAPPPLNT